MCRAWNMSLIAASTLDMLISLLPTAIIPSKACDASLWETFLVEIRLEREGCGCSSTTSNEPSPKLQYQASIPRYYCYLDPHLLLFSGLLPKTYHITKNEWSFQLSLSLCVWAPNLTITTLGMRFLLHPSGQHHVNKQLMSIWSMCYNMQFFSTSEKLMRQSQVDGVQISLTNSPAIDIYTCH